MAEKEVISIKNRNNYPFNLLYYIDEELYLMYLDDTEHRKGLEYAIKLLEQDDEKFICMKFKEGKTWHEIGNEFGITRQAANSIGTKIKRIMGKTKLRGYIEFGFSQYEKILQESRMLSNADEIAEKVVPECIITNLKRGGINKLSEVKSVSQLKCLRNIGDKKIKIITDIIYLIYGVRLPEK